MPSGSASPSAAAARPVRQCGLVALLCGAWNLLGDLCFMDFYLAHMSFEGFGTIDMVRKYDNDSDARRRGTYELTNARRLWVRCTMIAITTENSTLHRAIEASRARARESVDIRSPPRHTRR